MRIALITYSTRPRGSVVHTLALAEALVALGEQVTIFAVDRAEDGAFYRPVDTRVEVRIVPCEAPGDVEERVLRSIAALSEAVEPGDFDIVHAQDCIAANAVPGCVRTVHHIDYFTSPVLIACHERAIVGSRAHVCVSRPVADELAKGWGLPAKVIPNGVAAERFASAAGPGAAEERAQWRQRLGDGVLVLTVGGIEPRKGSLELLDAMAGLRERHPDARLVVAGGETLFDYRRYRELFEERREELALDVEVLGAVADADLPSLVASADVFALTSIREGFGMAAMEALAAGVPVVLRDGPVLSEVFRGAARFGRTAQSVGDALTSALEEPSQGRRARGRALAAAHTWAAAAEAHLEHYAAARARPLASAGAA